MNLNVYTFQKATSVWEKGSADRKNRTVSFCADIESKSAVIALAASCEYILTVNGSFVAHGPARTAHGFFRVDEYDLAPYLTKQSNRIAVRVAGYRVNSFDTLDQPGFLCAEILQDGAVVAATGSFGFTAYAVTERVERVQRYSFQRAFVETYRLHSNAFDYERTAKSTHPSVETEPAASGVFIARDIPYHADELLYPIGVIHRGKVSYSEKDSYYHKREIAKVESPRFCGFYESELEYASHIEIGKCDCSDQTDVTESADLISIDANCYADIDFGRNVTGIYELTLACNQDAEVFLVFDEILIGGEVKAFRPNFSNVMTFLCKAGESHLICMMPHGMRYARILAKGTGVTVRDLKLHHIAYGNEHIKLRYTGTDETLLKIYDAAIESFRANSTDIYMDCPTRERAGWLCDSFFTSRVEKVLTGASHLERAFLENFLLPDHFEHLPVGMLPMCYPSDHNDGTFIPNWAMWYALELCEYYERTGDRELIELARPRIYALLEYFRRFENEYGLLESLESWVFVEWSRANDLVQDVSFASNMLYSRMLRDLGRLYDDAVLLQKGESMIETINHLSMTPSGFYCDNAYRKNGKLELSGECTEACQYYAFFCGIATLSSHPWLWETLVTDFGYDRGNTGKFLNIAPANAFIGNYLRLDLLLQNGLHAQLLDNIKGYFSYMAERTGTLWENISATASCNHGFASHVLYWMDGLGLLEHT